MPCARALILLLLTAWVGCSSSPSPEDVVERRAPRPVSSAGLTADLRALDAIARRHGGDRAAGTAGYDASVHYVAGRLRDAGWRVTLQGVPLRVPSERSPARLSVAALGPLKTVADFRVPTYSGAGAGRGPVASVGTGCAGSDFDALEDAEVALAQPGGCFNFAKARNAARAGALALLVAGQSGSRGVPSSTLVAPVALPVLAVSRRVTRALEPGSTVAFRVRSDVARSTTQNVIAEAGEGRSVVMAGAHLDSVPEGPGINDNASGVAALLAAADALGSRPRRRTRLAFWGAEELGLVGSRHYVRSLPAERRREIAAYLNFDMVGSPNAVAAVYSDADARLTRLLRAAHPGREAGVAVGEASDHAPFADAGIAVSGLYTGSSESGPGGQPRDSCYHLPCDSLTNVDRTVLLGMARAVVRALREVEDQP